MNDSRVQNENLFKNTTGLKYPAPYLSASQVTTYSLCPMSYYWSYVENKKEIPAPKAIIGIVGHKTLELLSDMNNLDFTTDELVGHFEIAFRSTMEELPTKYKDDNKDEICKVRDGMVPSLAYYCKNEFKKLNIIAQETQVNKEIPIYKKAYDKKGKLITEGILGELTFVGFIDFINYKENVKVKKLKGTIFSGIKDLSKVSSMEIGDYKTGAEKDYTFFMGDYQLAFYSYATGIKNVRVDNITPSRVKFNKDGGPRKDNIPPTYSILKHVPKEQDIQIMLEQFSNVAIGIGMGSFPRCHSSFWKCSPEQCGHWNYCRGKDAEKYASEVAHEKYADLIK